MDTIIIGAGQAGVCLSYFLQQYHISHLVLEQDRAFSAWHNRWDAFRMNTANWMNALPGSQREFLPGAHPDDIATGSEALDYFHHYLRSVDPPLKEDTEVTHIEQQTDGIWTVVTEQAAYQTTSVAICTGHTSHPKFPAVASDLPTSVPRLHTADYRNPDQIQTANALVVGSGSSGIQICEDLARSNRLKALYLATSKNMVIPWHILGIPIGALPRHIPVFDIRRNTPIGEHIYRQMQKRGDPAMAPSSKTLAKKYGVLLTGKVTAVQNNAVHCADNQIVPLDDLTVIWCTGFAPNFDRIHVPDRKTVFSSDGLPIHNQGVVPAAPGLYFLGLRFQHTVASNFLYGVGRDAAYIAGHIHSRLASV